MTSTHFELLLPHVPHELTVVRFTGEEAMNALFVFDVIARTTTGPVSMGATLETAAVLTLKLGSTARAVHAIVGRYEAMGVAQDGAPLVRIRLVPRLARLKRRRTSRIFQERTARQIVEEVLAISGIQNRWHLSQEPSKRKYCVQYDETDYRFIRRICASEGIFFSFDHPPTASTADSINATEMAALSPSEVVVFSDTPDAYQPIAGHPLLQYRRSVESSGLSAGEDHVLDFRIESAVKTGGVLFRRYDFERPPVPVRDAASSDQRPNLHSRADMREFVDSSLTIYEHQNAREEALLEPSLATRALEAERASAVVARGHSACRRLASGKVFTLVDHPLSDIDGGYLITELKHEGYAPEWCPEGREVYRNDFSTVPATVAFRPKRAKRVIRQTFETATVVGPVGEEVFTDVHGRIKVQFHWDLQGNYDDKSSCWLRVAQSWAGAGLGAQFLPRVGHEVLVGYIDGDADRPIVVGNLHNGLNQTPFAFPRDLQQSGIKTTSTPGGGGSHEILLDDKKGAELMALRSSRTLELAAAQNATVRADGDMNMRTGGDRTDEVRGDLFETIDGSEQHTTRRDRNTTIERDEIVANKGSRELRVNGREVRRIDGNAVHVFGGARTTIVGGDLGKIGDEQLSVAGHYRAGSVGEMTLASEERVVISCGTSKITLLPDRILFEANALHLQAHEDISLVQGDPPQATMRLQGSASMGGGTVSLVAGGKDGLLARLFLDDKAHLDGVQVLLNCGPMGSAGGEVVTQTDARGNVTFTVLAKGLGAEVTTVLLFIATPSGEVIERACPVGGTVTVEGKVGDVFTVVDAKVDGKSVPVNKILTKGGS